MSEFGVDPNISFDIDFCEDDKTVKLYIKQCEGKHVQQISYSSYHDSLTQICFGCRMIRTSIKKQDVNCTKGVENE